jgi:hypothetical protein
VLRLSVEKEEVVRMVGIRRGVSWGLEGEGKGHFEGATLLLRWCQCMQEFSKGGGVDLQYRDSVRTLPNSADSAKLTYP